MLSSNAAGPDPLAAAPPQSGLGAAELLTVGRCHLTSGLSAGEREEERRASARLRDQQRSARSGVRARATHDRHGVRPPSLVDDTGDDNLAVPEDEGPRTLGGRRLPRRSHERCVRPADRAIGVVPQAFVEDELIARAFSPPRWYVDELEARLPVQGNQLECPRRGAGLLGASCPRRRRR